MGVPFPALKTMVTVLLLMGNLSPVVLSCSATVAQVEAVASEVVTAGASLTCFSPGELATKGYKVTSVVVVENWTNYLLVLPRLRIASGYVTTFPTVILPGQREAFALHMERYRNGDVYGTVSWELAGTKRRFVLMWSVSIDFYTNKNWMGMGMTKEGDVQVLPDNRWFDQMYYNNNNDNLTFTRKEFYTNLDPLTYRNDQFEVVGKMTRAHRSLINVIVRPSSKRWELLAGPIREKLQG